MNEKITLSGVPETMLQTLYARAKETCTRGAIRDEKATALVERIDYDFSLADDYIEKPFSPSVLVARVKANPAHPQLLQTVWGVGYRLRKDNEPS